MVTWYTLFVFLCIISCKAFYWLWKERGLLSSVTKTPPEEADRKCMCGTPVTPSWQVEKPSLSAEQRNWRISMWSLWPVWGVIDLSVSPVWRLWIVPYNPRSENKQLREVYTPQTGNSSTRKSSSFLLFSTQQWLPHLPGKYSRCPTHAPPVCFLRCAF